jgi:integrase
MDDNATLKMAWEAARKDWLAGKRRNTAKAYRIAWRDFFAWAGVRPWEVTGELAVGWAKHLAATGLAARSINLKVSALASFYDFVRGAPLEGDRRRTVLWPVERANPFVGVARPPRSPYRGVRPLSPDEVRAVLAAINTGCLTGARDYALLLTPLVTGRRISEVLGMRWGDLEPMGEGGYVFTYRGRDGRLRGTTLPGRCYRAICAYLEKDGRPPERMGAGDYVFVPLRPERVRRLPGHADTSTGRNRPVTVGFANRVLKKYARRAGVDIRKATLRGWRVGEVEGWKDDA